MYSLNCERKDNMKEEGLLVVDSRSKIQFASQVCGVSRASGVLQRIIMHKPLP